TYSSRVFKFSTEFLNKKIRYCGDGILFSTPIGSKAYNLSLDGPIIEGNIPCFIMNPIAPFHSSTIKYVFSKDVRVKLKIEDAKVPVYLNADGQRELRLKKGNTFTIELIENLFSFLIP
ncbi:MAG: hypothetical protein DRI22_03050, partial [Caldiserica bacterium]